MDKNDKDLNRKTSTNMEKQLETSILSVKSTENLKKQVYTYVYINNIYGSLDEQYENFSPSIVRANNRREAFLKIFKFGKTSLQHYFIRAYALVGNKTMMSFIKKRVEEIAESDDYDEEDILRARKVSTGEITPKINTDKNGITSIKWESEADEETWDYVMHRFSPLEFIADYGNETYEDMKTHMKKALDEMILEFMKIAELVNQKYQDTIVSLSGYEMELGALFEGKLNFVLYLKNVNCHE